MNLQRNEIMILSAKRTPIGHFGGYFKETSAITLGAQAIPAATNIPNTPPIYSMHF